MHVHIDGKDDEKITRYTKIKHIGAQNSKEPSKIFRLHSNKGPLRQCNAN